VKPPFFFYPEFMSAFGYSKSIKQAAQSAVKICAAVDAKLLLYRCSK